MKDKRSKAVIPALEKSIKTGEEMPQEVERIAHAALAASVSVHAAFASAYAASAYTALAAAYAAHAAHNAHVTFASAHAALATNPSNQDEPYARYIAHLKELIIESLPKQERTWILEVIL